MEKKNTQLVEPPKIGNGLVLLIREGKSIQLKLVDFLRIFFFIRPYEKDQIRQSDKT